MRMSPDQPGSIKYWLRHLLTHADLLLALLLALLSGGLYWRGVAPSVVSVFDDSLEFPLVVHQLAIAHPTGYPLYTLLGKGFSLFNPGNPAFQLNLMSAAFAAITVGLMYLTGRQLQPEDVSATAGRLGAVGGALVFAVGPVFYSQATIAEVYTLHACLMLALLYVSLKGHWLAAALVFGLGLAHHRTTVLWMPALAVFMLSWPEARQTLRRRWPVMALLAGLPLLLYLYLPWRGHIGSLDGSYVHTWAGFWRHVSGGGYSTFLQDNPLGTVRDAGFYLNLFRDELTWPGLVTAGLGLAAWIRWRCWWALGLTGLAFLTMLIFNLAYAVSDIAVFFIPLFALVALWAGVGWSTLLQYLRYPWLQTLVTVLGIVLLLGYPRYQSRADAWQVHYAGLDQLQAAATDGAVVGILGEMTLLRYFQAVQHVNPELETYVADRDPVRLAEISRLRLEDAARPVYTTRELLGLPEQFSLAAAGPLIEVLPQPRVEPPPVDQVLNQPLNDSIAAYGYRWETVISPPQMRIRRLVMVWQATMQPQDDYKISARLLDTRGKIVAMVDKTPVHFAYPTRSWRPGEYVIDVYDWSVQAEAPTGPYTPLLILYNPAADAVEVARLTLPETWFAP